MPATTFGSGTFATLLSGDLEDGVGGCPWTLRAPIEPDNATAPSAFIKSRLFIIV